MIRIRNPMKIKQNEEVRKRRCHSIDICSDVPRIAYIGNHNLKTEP